MGFVEGAGCARVAAFLAGAAGGGKLGIDFCRPLKDFASAFVVLLELVAVGWWGVSWDLLFFIVDAIVVAVVVVVVVVVREGMVWRVGELNRYLLC
jgi:hypothetical protein